MTRADGLRTGLGFAARAVLGVVFVWAGVAKILSPDPFATAIDWVSVVLGLPAATLDVSRVILPRAEVVLGLCLIAGLYLRPALWLSTATLLGFLALLVAGTVQKGGIEACGCFGQRVLDSGGPAAWIARDAALAALALAAAILARSRWALDGVLVRRREASGMLADDPGAA